MINEVGSYMGGRRRGVGRDRRERLILRLLLGGTRYIHGSF